MVAFSVWRTKKVSQFWGRAAMNFFGQIPSRFAFYPLRIGNADDYNRSKSNIDHSSAKKHRSK
jgi:hypothetical protein